MRVCIDRNDEKTKIGEKKRDRKEREEEKRTNVIGWIVFRTRKG